jgi:hypothetical protein
MERSAGWRALWFYPTIGAAIRGRTSVVDLLLPRLVRRPGLTGIEQAHQGLWRLR